MPSGLIERFNNALAQVGHPDYSLREFLEVCREVATALSAVQEPVEREVFPRPLDSWHEDFGPVTWWKLPVEEPAWIGTPLDTDWPGYHTHWTPHPNIPALPSGGK